MAVKNLIDRYHYDRVGIFYAKCPTRPKKSALILFCSESLFCKLTFNIDYIVDINICRNLDSETIGTLDQCFSTAGTWRPFHRDLKHYRN